MKTIGLGGNDPIYDRMNGHKEIQRLCFDAIKTTFESYLI
jgi:hypothetical protein